LKHPVSNDRPIALVVEDEPLVEMEAIDLLNDLGYDAIGARNADEAVLILRARPDVSLVFTDIEMPGTMNGLALAALIEATWPHIQILITSGAVLPPNQQLVGNACFVAKPYSGSQIELALASV
jgi:CheY-like chemotaxis protein